jgi:hypothetical protein
LEADIERGRATKRTVGGVDVASWFADAKPTIISAGKEFAEVEIVNLLTRRGAELAEVTNQFGKSIQLRQFGERLLDPLRRDSPRRPNMRDYRQAALTAAGFFQIYGPSVAEVGLEMGTENREGLRSCVIEGLALEMIQKSGDPNDPLIGKKIARWMEIAFAQRRLLQDNKGNFVGWDVERNLYGLPLTTNLIAQPEFGDLVDCLTQVSSQTLEKQFLTIAHFLSSRKWPTWKTG